MTAEYTGEVARGGPADVRELPGLTVTKVSVGPYDNNAYFLRCTHTGEQLLIDAANEADRLLRMVGRDPLVRIVTTHRHQDHWMALEEVQHTTDAEVVAHPLDSEGLPISVARQVEQGDTVTVGQARLSVIHLRGHTPGSIALLYDADGELAGQPHLFTGDSLFPGGVGNTWGDDERFQQLLTDVEERIFNVLPDDTWVYPGHGKDTTLGKERSAIPDWWERRW